MNCFRYLKTESLYDIEILTLYEYEMRMRAFNLARIDKEYDIALQAWLNNQATATKTTGTGKSQKTESVYKGFQDFFDYERKLKEVDGPSRTLTEKEQRMARIAASTNSKGGG